jgi:hypothetical protein
MAIHIDVITQLDSRAIAENAALLETEYGAIGVRAGEALQRGVTTGMSRSVRFR